MGNDSIYHEEIVKKINEFMRYRKREFRYASFDFCYLYFYSHRGKQLTDDMELSCLQLWSYLASWGMLRGSSELLQKSPASLVPLIEHISKKVDNRLWNIDIDNYSDDNIELLLDEYTELGNLLKFILNNGDEQGRIVPSKTLITKVMLGVYSNIPAFDNNFCKTYQKKIKKTNRLDKTRKDVLLRLASFYEENKEALDRDISIIDFDGKDTCIKYKKVKLLDMYGFIWGRDKNKKEEKKQKKLAEEQKHKIK